MVIISGTIKVESAAEFARLKDALIARAQKSRADAGNIDYVFTQNLEDPAEIRLIEKWQDEDSLNAHLKIPDEAFNAVLANAKIVRAIVISSTVSSEKELMKR